MVLFKEGDEHFANILMALNEFRSTFYDISLTGGNKQIHAHKNVLIAGSSYFKSLLGPFTEASKSKNDLSSTTVNNSAMESIVDYLYTGVIDIDNDNLEAVMKLFSFLLISTLQDICAEFIRQNINPSSVKYYLENKLTTVVKSRMHDCLVFTVEILQLETNQFMHLFEKRFFEFCTVLEFLNFLTNWITHRVSDGHLAADYDSLDYIESGDMTLITCDSEFEYSHVKQTFDRLTVESNVTKRNLGKQFNEKFLSIIKSLESQADKKSKDESFLSLNSRQEIEKPEHHQSAPTVCGMFL